MSAETTSEAARSLSRAGTMLHEVAAAEIRGAEFGELRAQAIQIAGDALRLLGSGPVPCVECRTADADDILGGEPACVKCLDRGLIDDHVCGCPAGDKYRGTRKETTPAATGSVAP